MARNVSLLIIDPQNDFCDLPEDMCPGQIAPALPVPGSHADMLVLQNLIQGASRHITDITVTRDSHPPVAIERTTFWRKRDGSQVAPFTVITADDVERGDYRPLENEALVLSQLRRLDARGRHQLVVWPVHCVTGQWGFEIHAELAATLAAWQASRGKRLREVLKGECPWSEHYGVFEAEAPLDDVPATQFNTQLAVDLTQGVDLLLVAGEASSHCVAASVEQLLEAIQTGRIPKPAANFEIALLTDCMSPVVGFEQTEAGFFGRAVDTGVTLMTAREALARLEA